MSVTRRVRIYVVLLIVLVALFVIGTILGPRRGQALGPVFSGLETAAVQTIEISSGALSVRIQRHGQSWVIGEGSREYPARTDRVQSLLDEVVASGLVRHVTGNQNLWPDFELTDESGTQLTLRSGADGGAEQVRTVVWGGSAAEPGLSYLRVGQTPDVYTSDGELQFYLRQPSSYWSYLRVLPEDIVVADVIAFSSSASIFLAQDEQLMFSYDLEREVAGAGEVWLARTPGRDTGPEGVAESRDAPRPLEANAVAALLRDVVDLVGSDFSRDVQSDRLPLVGRLEIVLADGREYVIEIFQSGETFVCRAAGPALPGDPFAGLAYELTTAKVRRLFPALSELDAE